MIDPSKVCFFIPAGLRKFKLSLFNRIGQKIEENGGRVVRHDANMLASLSREIIPIVGCQPESTDLIIEWRKTGRPWIYWDRGYAKRWFATSLPRPQTIEDSYYRWHLNGFQMKEVAKVPDDRWKALGVEIKPWAKSGRHIVIAAPSKTYTRFHRIDQWIADTIDALARVTNRQLVIRDKEHVLNRPLSVDLEGAHCLVTHGSIAAIESVIMGCPVFVHPDSAAALVGKTDLKEIERPVYPEREPWLHSLAYCQATEHEFFDGTLWNLIR